MSGDTLVRTMSYEGFPPCICRDHEPSIIDRPALFLPIILVMFVGFLILFALARLPYGIQVGSLIPYTAFIVLGTFSAQRGQQPYFFECPFVRNSLPSLVLRHLGFLFILVVLEAVAFDFSGEMPPSWLVVDARGESPFGMSLCVLCIFLALIQILTNRSLIKRVHLGH